MTPERKGSYQLHFDEEIPETLYFFSKETVIYPQYSKRGVLTNNVFAEKIEGYKVRGLTAFKSRQRLYLYLDNRYWTLPEGTIFGAYAKNAKRREIK